MNTILSIVIPTRNRFSYVKSAIRSVLAIGSPEIELVIQDSSDGSDLEKWISSNIHDKRLVYNYTKPPLSMTDNFNNAVGLATGEYVCVIGDDDGVNPEIVAAAYWARDNSLDAVAPSLSGASYCWPDFCSRDYGQDHAGKLFVNKFTGEIAFPNIDAEMVKCARSAGQNKFGLPKPYFGLIRRSCFLKVKEVVGCFFQGVSPDVFGALTNANYMKRVCIIDYPLVVPGSSGGSNSGRSALGRHKGNLKDDPHMDGYDMSQWPEGVPEFFSVQTVWAEAAVAALHAVRRNDLLAKFNWELLHALCIVYHPDYLTITIRSFRTVVRRYKPNYLWIYGNLIKNVLLVSLKRIARFIYRKLFPNRGVREKQFGCVDNIESAVYELTAYLNRSGYSFASIIEKRN